MQRPDISENAVFLHFMKYKVRGAVHRRIEIMQMMVSEITLVAPV